MQLVAEFEEAIAWSSAYNVPIFLGEFGVGSFANAASRCNWIITIGDILANTNLPWAYWDMKYYYDSFGFFENDLFLPENIMSCFADALQLQFNPIPLFAPFQPSPEMAKVIVYPNPATDLVHIYAPEMENVQSISIFNPSGQLLQTATPTGNLKQCQFNVRLLPPNIYTLLIHYKNGYTQAKKNTENPKGIFLKVFVYHSISRCSFGVTNCGFWVKGKM